MNRLPKIVFSATLDQVDRSNSRLVKQNAAAEVATLKQQLGGGKRPFDGLKQRATFKLAKTYTVTSGVVQLSYVPA